MSWIAALFIGWLLGCAFMYVMDRAFLIPREAKEAVRRVQAEREQTVKSMASALDKN